MGITASISECGRGTEQIQLGFFGSRARYTAGPVLSARHLFLNLCSQAERQRSLTGRLDPVMPCLLICQKLQSPQVCSLPTMKVCRPHSHQALEASLMLLFLPPTFHCTKERRKIAMLNPKLEALKRARRHLYAAYGCTPRCLRPALLTVLWH